MLERLIRREKPENLTYCAVLQVDPGNRRVMVRGRNGLEFWAEYLPDDFPGLGPDHIVSVGTTGRSAFLISRVSSVIPSETVILEV